MERGMGWEEEGKEGEGGTCSKVLGGIDAPAVSFNSSVTERTVTVYLFEENSKLNLYVKLETDS